MKKGTTAFLSLIAGVIAGFTSNNVLSTKKIIKKQDKIDKFKNYYNMLNQWLVIKQEGKSLVEYFHQNEYKTIAIYGMGEMGNRLYDELKNSDVEIKYVVDKNADSTYAEVEVLDPEDDEFEDVDVIVVTATFAFDDISETISEKTDCRVVSLDDVVYNI